MIDYDGYSKIRDSKGLKDSDVCRMTGIPQATFSEWKKGKYTPKYEKMFKIATALDMDYRDFVGTIGKCDELNPNRPGGHRGVVEVVVDPETIKASVQAVQDRELLRLFHNATKDAQTSVMTLLRNSQREKSSDSLKEA